MIFKPHSQKQNRIIFSEKKITIAATGIQFGKTLSGVVWLKKYMHRHTSKDDNFIITTPTYKILKQATLPPFMRMNEALGRLNKADMCFEMYNGGNVWIRSGQNPDSVVGITNVRAILCDEGGLYSRYFWDNIQARSSFSSCPVCIVTSPYSLNWLYTDFIRKIQQKDPYIMDMCEYVHAASYENPYFPKAEYDQRKMTMDSHRFSMIYGGNFGRMEGLVYKCFDEDVDVIDPIPLPEDTQYYGGIDWGYTDPMVITIRAVLPSGYQYQIAEYYKTQQTIRDVIEMAKSYNAIYKKVIFVCDPSRPEYIRELNQNGIIAYPAKNDIRLGIDYHYDLIANKKYKVFRNTSPHTIDEYSQYHYPEPKDLKPDQGQKDMLPVDFQNHCIAEGSLITTARGDIPIEQVTTDDYVLTRNGYRKVLFSGLTAKDAKIIEIMSYSGNILRCTSNHLIWTSDGFLFADRIRCGDVIMTLVNKNFVRKCVNPNGEENRESITSKENVQNVINNSQQINTQKQKPVLCNVEKVSLSKQRANVYDLKIDKDPEFFCDGVLVHNCMDTQRYITMQTYNFAGHKKKIIIKDHNVKEALPYLIDPDQEKLFKKRRLA